MSNLTQFPKPTKTQSIIFVLCCCLISVNSLAQEDFSRYFNLDRIRLVDVQDYEELPFQWNMTGPVQAAMIEGLNHIHEGLFDKAVLNFDDVIKQEPSFQAAWYYRGVSYKKQFKLKEAKESLLKAIRINKKAPQPRLELGEIYQVEKNWDKAIAEFDQITTDNKNYVKGYYARGLLEVEREKGITALRMFLKCEDLDKTFAPAIMARGLLEVREPNGVAKSIPIFDKAIAADSTFHETYFWRGLAYMVLNQQAKALADWNRALLYFPTNPFMLMMRGFAYVEVRKYNEAYIDFRKVLKAYEVDANRFVGGETVLDQQIDMQNAAVYMVSHCYGLEEEALSTLKKGFCLLLAGKGEGMESLNASARMAPSACAYYLMAAWFDMGKYYNDAMTYYGKALSYDKDIPDAHKKMALYYNQLKMWDEMDKEFNEVLRLQPESPVVYRLRGMVKFERKDYPGSVADMKKLLQLDSTDVDGRKILALAMYNAGDYSGSNVELEKLLVHEPANESLYDYKARNSLGLKDTANAISIYRKRKLKTIDPVPRLGLARVFIAQKKWIAASHETEEIFHPPVQGSISFTLAAEFASEAFFIQGQIAIGLNNDRQAVIELERAIRTLPGNYDARYLRATVYRRLGEKKNAADDLQVLVKASYPGAKEMVEEMGR